MSPLLAVLREPAVDATQSGPLLVPDGQINGAFNATGTSRLIRNGVGVLHWLACA